MILSYKSLDNTTYCRKYLKKAIIHLKRAQDALHATQEGTFKRWYAGDALNGKFNLSQKINLLNAIYNKMK